MYGEQNRCTGSKTDVRGTKPVPVTPQVVKSKINLNYVTIFITYRAVNT